MSPLELLVSRATLVVLDRLGAMATGHFEQLLSFASFLIFHNFVLVIFKLLLIQPQ